MRFYRNAYFECRHTFDSYGNTSGRRHWQCDCAIGRPPLGNQLGHTGSVTRAACALVTAAAQIWDFVPFACPSKAQDSPRHKAIVQAMVKKVTLEAHLDFIEPQIAFPFLFGDDRFVKRYHREINEDSHAEVSRWSGDGQRHVMFVTPLNAPSVVRKLVGADILKVRDIQRHTRTGHLFRIQSDPIIDIPGGERFSTSGEIILAPGYRRKGTLITINIRLEFKGGVWGMQGTMESFLEDQAKRSFEGWIKLARAFCQEELDKSRKIVHSPTASEESVYLDLERLDSEPPARVVDASPALPLATTLSGEQQHLQIWFVNSVMRELNGIQMSTTVSKAHLEMLLSKVQRLEDDLHVIKCLLQRRNSSFDLGTTTRVLCGLGVATVVFLGIRCAYLRGTH